MAQLIRTKRAQVIKPTGIVKMTGLHHQAATMKETAKAIEGVGDFFYEKGLKEAAKRGLETAYESPTEREMRSLATKDGLAYADANGRPIDAEFVRTAPRQDAGLFQREEAIQHNSALAVKEKTDTIISAQGTLEQWYIDGTESLDPESFEAKGQAYMTQLIDNAHDDIKASVAAQVQPYFQKRLNAIKIARRERDIQVKNENNKIMREQQETELLHGLTTHDLSDVGIQDQLATLYDTYHDRVGSDYASSQADRDFESFVANTVVRSTFANQIANLMEDSEGFTRDDEGVFTAELAKFLDGSKEFEVPDPATNFKTTKKIPVGMLIKDREQIFNRIKGTAAVNRQINVIAKDISNQDTADRLDRAVAEYTFAMTMGDSDGAIAAEDKLMSIYDEMDNPTAERQVANVFQSMQDTWRSKQEHDRTASTRRKADAAAESKRKGLELSETVTDELIERMQKALGPVVGDVAGYILDEEDRAKMVSEMGLTERVKNKAQQLTILQAHFKAMQPSEHQREIINAITSKSIIDWSKTHSDELNKYFGIEMLKDTEGQWSAQRTIEVLDPYVRLGMFPESAVTAMRTAVASGDSNAVNAAYALYHRMKSSNAMTADRTESILGDELDDALHFMRSSVFDYGLRPDHPSVLDGVRSIMSGEGRQRFSEIARDNPDITEMVNERIDDFMEDAPHTAKQSVRRAFASRFRSNTAMNPEDMIDLTLERVAGDKGLVWGKSRYTMSGDEEWVQYGLEQQFPNFTAHQDADKTINKFVENNAFQEAGKDIYANTKITPHFYGTDPEGNPQYIFSASVVEGGEVDITHLTLKNKDGGTLVFRPMKFEKIIKGRDALVSEMTRIQSVLKNRYDHINDPHLGVSKEIRGSIDSIGLSISNLNEVSMSTMESLSKKELEHLENLKDQYPTPQLINIP